MIFSDLVALLLWLPICIGIWRFRNIERPYRIFLGYLFVCAAVEHTAMFIRDISMRNRIQDSYSLLSSLLLLQMIREMDTAKRPRFSYPGFMAAMICIMLIDHFCRPLDQPKIPWGFMLCLLILILHVMQLFSKTLSFGIVRWYRQTSILIFLPLIVHYLFFVLLMLLMSILYGPETQSFFLNIYQIINVINFFTYLSYTLALLWAPKTEKFL